MVRRRVVGAGLLAVVMAASGTLGGAAVAGTARPEPVKSHAQPKMAGPTGGTTKTQPVTTRDVAARQAVTRVYTVTPGHDFDDISTLDAETLTCTGTRSGAATFLGRKGGTRGDHAIGWGFGSTSNLAEGVEAYSYDPISLSAFSTKVYSPTAGGSGIVSVYLTDPSKPNGYWIGRGTWTNSLSGWVTLTLTGATLHWTYYESGQSPVDYGNYTIRNFALSSSTAWLAIGAGCDNETVYFDEFRVADDYNDITYDFEGTPTDTDMHRYNADTQKLVRVDHNYIATVPAGTRRWVAGDHWDRGDDQIGYNDDDNLLGFTAHLYQKVWPSTTFRSVKTSTASSTNDYWAWFQIAPPRRVTYQIRFGGSGTYEASNSNTVTFNVRRGVPLQIVDKSLVAGQTMIAKGQISPGDKGVKLYVQRYLNGAWRNLRSGYTGTSGAYKLPYTVKSAGTWRVRVLAVTAKGVLSNHSPDRYVTVKPRPKVVPPPDDDKSGGYTYVPPKPEPKPPAPKPINHL